MSWSEINPCLYQRPLGVSENVMAAATTGDRPIPREPIKVHTDVNFTAPFPSGKVTSAFKDAWKAVRLFKSPDIATTFKDGLKQYKVPTAEELENWVEATFEVTGPDTTAQETIQGLQLRRETLPMCLILPESTPDGTFKGTLLLWISHWRIEASGSLKIINELFDYASDLLVGGSTREAISKHVHGSEVNLLTPSVEDMMMPNQESTPEAIARVDKRFANYSAQLPTIDYPLQGGFTDLPKAFKVNQRTYTPASTSSLVAACRSKGITVTAAVQSAYIGAVRSVADLDKKDRPYTIMMPAEVRKRLPASSPFRDQGCWNSSQMLLLSVPANQDFITSAQTLKRQYGLANETTWLYEDMRAMSEGVIKHFSLAASSEPAALAWFTSFGVLDGDVLQPEHGGMKIEYVTSWADSLGPGIVFRMLSFKGRLNVHIAWNAAYHGDREVSETMDIMEKIIATELGVELAIEDVRLMEY